MVLNYLRQNKIVEKKKIFVYASLQGFFTIILLISSFTVVNVPIFFVIPYIAVFTFFLFLSIRYTNKLVHFWQDDNKTLFVNFEAYAHISYLTATIARFVISIIIMFSRIEILQILGIQHQPYIISEPNITLLIFATIVFDFLLLAGKGMMVGMHKRMLKEYNQIHKNKNIRDV